MLISSGKIFEQTEPTSVLPGQFFNWKRADALGNLPAAVQRYTQKPQPQSVVNFRRNFSPQPIPPAQHGYWSPQFMTPELPQNIYQPNIWQQQPTPRHTKNLANTLPYQRSKTYWEEFKRIYVTEVIAFTMNKSTLFTLIFSFMFLGCIFFLSGFFAAASVYKNQHTSQQPAPRMPSETAMLQGQPEKMVNMDDRGPHAPAYEYQGGIRLNNSNQRRPSAYAEQQIAASNPQYR